MEGLHSPLSPTVNEIESPYNLLMLKQASLFKQCKACMGATFEKTDMSELTQTIQSHM